MPHAGAVGDALPGRRRRSPRRPAASPRRDLDWSESGRGLCGPSKADFIAKTCIALKEAREASYWQRLVDARKLLPHVDLKPDIQEADEIIAILTTIVKRARQSPFRG
jgi:hypothetical protein